jgi:hypothetical protein
MSPLQFRSGVLLFLPGHWSAHHPRKEQAIMAGETSASIKVSTTVAGISLSATDQVVTFDTPGGFQKTITAPQTNYVIDGPQLINADVQLLGFLASVDCVLHTNDNDAPDDTITLKANVPVFWTVKHPSAAKPIAHDVTSWHLVLGGTTACTLKIISGSNTGA